MAPAYHRKEGGTQHRGEHKHSLQYDGRSDERVEVRVGKLNVGSLSGKGREVREEMRKRMIGVYRR